MKTYTELEVKDLIYRAIRNHEEELENDEKPFITTKNGNLSNRGQVAYNKTLELMHPATGNIYQTIQNYHFNFDRK